MFHLTTCPTCQTKFTIPESNVGRRQVCPHCQSPFVAGKAVAVADVPMNPEPAVANAYNKTMIGDMGGPPIRFNCPRCKKPMEVPVIEAGAKKPCPSCGQRLQVPAAPPAPVPAVAAAAPGLDKTMLASDGANTPVPGRDPNLNKTMLADTGPPIRFDCPRCKKTLEVPAIEANTKRPCPHCSQRLLVPAASTAAAGLNKTMLASDGSSAIPSQQPSAGMAYSTTGQSSPAADGTTAGGMWSNRPDDKMPFNLSKRTVMIAAIAGGVFLLFLLLIVIAPGRDTNDQTAAKKEAEELERKLEKLKQEQARIKTEEVMFEEMKKQNDKRDREIADLYEIVSLNNKKSKNQQLDLEDQYRNLSNIQDADLRLQAKRKLDDQQAKLRKDQLEYEEQLNQIEKQKDKVRQDEFARKQAEQARLDREHQLQIQMQQNQAAMNAALINASRPTYSPWNPYRYWP
jgi:DNA-directed RNA polymerase subunit RPC12/RpoP